MKMSQSLGLQWSIMRCSTLGTDMCMAGRALRPGQTVQALPVMYIANTIRIIRQDCEVIDILSGTPRKKLYDIKKTKTTLKGVRTGLKVKENADCKETLKAHSDIFLLDNMVNTGFTFNRARKALRKYVKVEPSLLAISATSNWLN